MQAQQRGRLDDHRRTDQSARADEDGTQTGDHAVGGTEMRPPFSRPIGDQQLVLDEYGFGHQRARRRDRRVGQRSPAGAETGRTDRAPLDPTKITIQARTFMNFEFAMDRHSWPVAAQCLVAAARYSASAHQAGVAAGEWGA
jgi:hypothetical protein